MSGIDSPPGWDGRRDQAHWGNETVDVWRAALEYCAAQRPVVAAGTYRSRRYTLAGFAHVAGPDLPVRKLKRRHVEAWLQARDDLAPATVRAQLGVIRSFCQWLTDDRRIPHNPCAGITAPEVPPSIPRECQADEITKLLNSVPDLRGELAVLLMVEEGLRIGEVVSRQIGDIDFPERLLFVVGKGRRERWVPLRVDTWDALERYLHAYPATSGPLIRSYHHPNRPITASHLGHLVALWMRAAGIKKLPRDGKSPHALRHTFVGHLLDAEVDPRDVQELTGHESLGSLWRYTKRRRAGGKLREATNKAPSYRDLPVVNFQA